MPGTAPVSSVQMDNTETQGLAADDGDGEANMSIASHIFGTVGGVSGFGDFDSPATVPSDGLLADIEGMRSHSRLSRQEISELRHRLLSNAVPSPSNLPLDFSQLNMNDLHGGNEKREQSEQRRDSLELPGPAIPHWMHNRPYGSLDFIASDRNPEDVGPLGDVAVSSQEQQLLEDVLSVMTGIEGTYITLSKQPPNPDLGLYRTFVVDSSVEKSVQALVQKVLPVCSQYAQLVRFIEDHSEHHKGLVNHALAAALTTLLKDYLLLVLQLESQLRSGVLTLHRLWFYVEKTAPVMDLLASITAEITKTGARGGAVLSLLQARVESLTGCGKLQELAVYLATAAAQPYLDCLAAWISRGHIKDPYAEFMVQSNEQCTDNEDNVDEAADQDDSDDNKEGNVDTYWQWRYTLEPSNTPSFLTSYADLILRTGKYLNVIKQSASGGRAGASSAPLQLRYSPDPEHYSASIETAYAAASKTLLHHLIDDQHLLSRIRSLKQYFLLAQGDFISQLLSMCESELSKPLDDVLPHRLEFLLELALRTSNGAGYQDSIHTVLLPYTLLDQMMRILSIETTEEQEHRQALSRLDLTGIEGFSLSCSVPWPASLVLDTRTLFCYRMLFRHLFYCKHVERQLCKVWLSNQACKGLPMSTRRSYTAAFLLRHRMLAFMQNIEYYMMFEVIERHWHQFLADMNKVESVDELLQHQSHFLDKCMKDGLLTTPDLLRTLTKIIGICASFASFILRSQKIQEGAELSPTGEDDLEAQKANPAYEETVPSASESFEQTIARYDIQFNGMLVTLMDKVADLGRQDYTDAIINILYRLDFNKYYSSRDDALTNLGECSMQAAPVDDHEQDGAAGSSVQG
ncbi:gamma-tubulin complex component 2 isoform X2 [Hyalella azteca]|uniref:Gamma-tubulin complex component n=1 Tax=Hyalella azteca TaxID=294128 RepID=A0A979FY65_HYAAZ|nr:gamma-tubulin complex component 2 isoform X2 [Hyalella azteca]